ncbi:hypothetical protein CDAR_465601 [Caerostris darwini]|uniref:Uncharacterized protein n=1 Tax=Caerostris darwini TaxID=1538125 RepID=A0AAV4TWQ9_9ARAC|nr:hypothetical protein CDAR_465601 [Caerostris darwini]
MVAITMVSIANYPTRGQTKSVANESERKASIGPEGMTSFHLLREDLINCTSPGRGKRSSRSGGATRFERVICIQKRSSRFRQSSTEEVFQRKLN